MAARRNQMSEKRKMKIVLDSLKEEISYMERSSVPTPVGALDAFRRVRDYYEQITKRLK